MIKEMQFFLKRNGLFSVYNLNLENIEIKFKIILNINLLV